MVSNWECPTQGKFRRIVRPEITGLVSIQNVSLLVILSKYVEGKTRSANCICS